MLTRTQSESVLNVDFLKGSITSLHTPGKEIISGLTPLFTVCLRHPNGDAFLTTAYDAKHCSLTEDGAVYSGFPYDMEVQIRISGADLANWHLSVKNRTDLVIEWVDFPTIRVKPLRKNGGDASILLPYNEGVLIDDAQLRQKSWFPHTEPEYPSHGSYYMFPYMLSSQFFCYLLEETGFYFGAHDTARGVKGLHIYPDPQDASSLFLTFRLFTGADFGSDYCCEYPIVWRFFTGNWYDGASIYREWLSGHLPQKVLPLKENPGLPEWYKDMPLVITYPVRGVHDMDEMTPNKLFPYENAMPMIEEIAAATGCRIMALLMHWEGTAPWAPPYVWPPFGGEELLNRFLQALHEKGHLLGVYCSGFGYTLQSNLIADYDRSSDLTPAQLEETMCTAPDGTVSISRICPGQRKGYDLCAASAKAQQILDQAYRPLLESRLDYAQILDQNHGGSQYFCYSKTHGHPPVPGSWMTQNMQTLLSSWQDTAGSLLLGCESAAAEPYMGNLLLSDNRYELNWHIGEPVPLYAFLYHEYLHNFMGNQVCCAFSNQEDTMCARLAYSFLAGDCMTLVMTPDGNLMNNWGCHDFSNLPDKKKALSFIANLNRFRLDQAQPYLLAGKMIKPLSYTCPQVTFPTVDDRKISLPTVFSTAWEAEGKRVQLFVNHTEQDITVQLEHTALVVPAMNGIMITLP